MKKSLSPKRGFTIIEVVIAFAIMAGLIALLIRGQSDSLKTAREGANLIIGSQLARKKLIDCKFDLFKEGFGLTDYKDSGNFSDDGFPEYTWECSAPHMDIPMPSVELFAQMGSNPEAQNNSIATILQMFYTPLATGLSNSVREMTAIVRWKSNGQPQEMKITTHIALVEQFAQSIGGLGIQTGAQGKQQPPQNPQTQVPQNPGGPI